jgi:cytochrome P450
LLNSGINAAWLLVYLANDPYWLSRCREEVYAVLAKHQTDSSLPIDKQLSCLPLEAWESEFPLIDMCLRESIRIQLLGTAFRKNISANAIPTGMGDEVIPSGAYVTYAIADAHLNPQIYKDPLKWDPARLLPDRAEDKKATHGYLGWGVGRHPCRKCLLPLLVPSY